MLTHVCTYLESVKQSYAIRTRILSWTASAVCPGKLVQPRLKDDQRMLTTAAAIGDVLGVKADLLQLCLCIDNVDQGHESCVPYSLLGLVVYAQCNVQGDHN